MGKLSCSTFGQCGVASALMKCRISKGFMTPIKRQGFDIIGVSLDDTEKELRDYIKENDIQWRQLFDNTRGEDSLVQQYGIRGTPAPWLIDRDGKLISHKARWEKLEGLVVEALKDKSANQ